MWMRAGENRISSRPTPAITPGTKARKSFLPRRRCRWRDFRSPFSQRTSGFLRRTGRLDMARLWAFGRGRPGGLDEVQDLGEKTLRLAGTTDMDDGGALQLMGEQVHDQLQYIIVEGTECAVDEHPRRRLYQHPRKDQTQLFVLAQFPIPTPGLIQERREALEPQPEQRAGKGIRAETVGLQGVCEDLAQTTARQVRRPARQIEYLLAARSRDASGAPGPQACQRAEQLCLSRPRCTENQDACSRRHHHARFSEPVGMRGGHAFQVFDPDRTRIAFLIVDAAFEAAGFMRADHGMPEASPPKQRRPPVRDDAEIVDEPAQG